MASPHVLDGPATRSEPGVAAATWVRRAGFTVTAVGLFGAVFPYFSNGLGLPIDGAPDGAMTLWRTVLHLVPGAAAVLAGVGLLDWARRLSGAMTIAHPERVANLGVAAGGWFAIGPYVWGLVQPAHAVGTGGMAGTMRVPGMSWIAQVMMPMQGTPVKETTATCAFTMGVDHWAVGALVVLASLAALGAGAARGPLAGLAGRPAPTAPTA